MLHFKKLFKKCFSGNFILVLLVLVAVLFLNNNASAQSKTAALPKPVQPQIARILLLYDDSQSMLAKWQSGTKGTMWQKKWFQISWIV